MGAAGALAATAMLALGVAETAQAVELRSGPLTATVEADPFRISFGGEGHPTLTQADGLKLGYRSATGWQRARRASQIQRDGKGIRAVVETGGGGEIAVELTGSGPGVIALSALPSGDAQAVGIGFDAPGDEGFFGFGSRSNAVDHRGLDVENYVEDGPTRESDRDYPRAFVPPWSHGERDDSTYYPVPWLLSSRGYGVLIDRDERSRFRLTSELADAWSLEVDAPALALRVFAGPTPAAALRRFTAATGRQPPPPTPWTFGPWFQTGQPNRIELDEEAQMIAAQRDADVPVSAAETQMHFLPCGAHRDDPEYNAARTKQFHAAGLAHLVYFNPSLCASYQPVWGDAAAEGLLIREATGQPHVYPAFVGGAGPAGFTTEPLSQFDYTAPGIGPFYGGLLKEAVAGGHDGWMEDFGEGVPPTGVAADGSTGSGLHNRYPTDYHCAVAEMLRTIKPDAVRHLRSGWTGTAACAVNVWGGDPTTTWGYDGLESGVRQALGIGMSGVSRFGTDIGGYNTYGTEHRLTPELLIRWIQFGAVSGVMRTKRSGLAFPPYERPQVFDEEILPHWRRYTKLHTQLYPYILAADAHYRRTGMPLMRHLALVAPGDAAAAASHNQFMFGPDLLAAPVTQPGAEDRELYLPRGRWVDWWRSVRYRRADGSFHPKRARVVRGGSLHTVPAPLGKLPLLARAGSVLPMLPADVDTLAPYGRGLVRLRDRRDRLTLLAFPRDRWRGRMFERGRLRSMETRPGGEWWLQIQGSRRRRYSVQAALSTLRDPFVPSELIVNGRRLRPRAWSFSRRTAVLRARFRARDAELLVRE
ncbi:MAG TPA: TIM-barrel domain-containing protein [Thermoleophilaceae bacterium]|nr:TIM-barrel domain-containing protein [Thermoleophilaceae bacterium]